MMKSFVKKAAALVLTAAMSCAALAGCGSGTAKVDGTKALLTLGDETLSLGAGSFYVRYQQAEMYKYWGSYFGQVGEMFDMVTDSSTGETYGDTMKETAIEDLKQMFVMREHAGEYDVELTEEQKTAIDEAAQAYVDSNTEEVLEMIGASKEDVATLLELQTIKSLMMDPIVADVDTNIPDEEVQQSSLTFVPVNITDDEDDSTDDAATAKETAQKILDAALAEKDAAEVDLTAIASGIQENLSSSTGTFTTNDPTDTYLDTAIVEAVKGLKEGTFVDHVIESEDGDQYFVVRFDSELDEVSTESERNQAIITRKQEKFDEVTEGWIEESGIVVDEEAWKTIILNDENPITTKDPVVSSAAAAEEAADSEAGE